MNLEFVWIVIAKPENTLICFLLHLLFKNKTIDFTFYGNKIKIDNNYQPQIELIGNIDLNVDALAGSLQHKTKASELSG
ncbi:hypothetical protein AML91_25150 [Paenibacillus jilunlii]|uniref:Lipid/polyisoprenoid-binding YceI-like domain-containing protein n=1 Tax=Paenibacillus jilunlii TaxID=682956 RepID=A0ABR5SLU8_9BACL|nr:hypothetical protein AML91_25150 [Paenibacillus jilunlii]